MGTTADNHLTQTNPTPPRPAYGTPRPVADTHGTKDALDHRPSRGNYGSKDSRDSPYQPEIDR